MTEQERSENVPVEISRSIRFEIPEAELPDDLLLPVYANQANVIVGEHDVVFTFSHITALQTRVGGETQLRNRVVQRVVLPRSIAKRMGEVLQETLGE